MVTTVLYPAAAMAARVREAADMLDQLPTADCFAKSRLATEGWIEAMARAAGVALSANQVAAEADAFDAAVAAELERRLSGRNPDQVEHYADQLERDGEAAWPSIRTAVEREMLSRAQRLGLDPSLIPSELATWELCIRDEVRGRRHMEHADG